MIQNLIKFEHIAWERPHEGVKQKVYSDGKTRLRLLQFNEDFIENDWCLKKHIGYVLNGEMKIDFDGTIKHYKKGDGLWIPEGIDSKHKVLIEKGKHVELILFEPDE